MKPNIRRPPTVLLVLANAEARFKARAQLQSQGFTVFATGEAQAALGWLQRHTADVVIADCIMPGTRMAIPHLLRRRGRTSCPKLIGIVREPLQATEELRQLLGFDELIVDGTPVVVLAKKVLGLQPT